MITAKIIADSVANDIRITTFELKYPRFIHSQFMTHRMFSRNASSSRAIPVERVISDIKDNCVYPLVWGENVKGMSSKVGLSETEEAMCKDLWTNSSRSAMYYANELSKKSLHKQVVNRLLEPFSHIRVIVTATEWDNFFNLRLKEDSQPEIQQLAKQIKTATYNGRPNLLLDNEWHLPYVKQWELNMLTEDQRLKVSAARCARVSYLNHDNSDPKFEKDLILADSLLSGKHMSPFEHQAKPMKAYKYAFIDGWEDGVTHMDRTYKFWSNNLRGWIQYRSLL